MKKNIIKKNFLKLELSATLLINEKSNALIDQGKKIYRFGFGQSPFPVPRKIVSVLKANAEKKDYLSTLGLPELREAISNNLNKFTHN